jgi:peptidoglycan/xylan/chitin deacetylase (PgdA/CDA1 family)
MTRKRATTVTPNSTPVKPDQPAGPKRGEKSSPLHAKTPSDRRPLGRRLRVLIGGITLGGLITLITFGLVALTPASSVDQRPYLIAMLFTATPTPSPTSTLTLTPTSSPTITFTPTITPTLTETLIPSSTPSPTITFTPSPQPTPDSRDREFWIPILMYHYISVPPADADVYRKDLSIKPEQFREQMQWLKDNGYQTISLTHLVYALNIGWPKLPEKPIILTFDDGYVDNYEQAFPILKEMGFIGTFFVLTDVTDREQPGYMNWDMLKEMNAVGMDIEVHGREHLEMIGRDESWLVFHLLGPAQTIEANLGYQPHFLAYPSGQYDAKTIEVAHNQGYWAAVTTQNGAHHTKTNLFELERVRIRGDWSLSTFISIVTGYGP